MKRILVVLLGLALVAAPTAGAQAGDGRRTQRTVVGSYGPYPAPVTGCNAVLGPYACVVVRTRPTESRYTAAVTDAHGRPVFVEVHSSDGHTAVFCGRTSRPLPVRPGATLTFHVGLDTWLVSTHCPAHRVKTTGQVRVTLSGRH